MHNRSELNRGNDVAIWRGDRLERVQRNVRSRYSTLLIAQLLVTPGTPSITHLALGSGIGNGTLALPQAPNPDGGALYNEVARVSVTSRAFDDPTNAEGDTFSDGVRTNRILVHTVVSAAVSQHLITEVGLFGGANASTEGTMFAWSTFPVVDNRLGGDDPLAPQDLTFDWVLKFPLIAVEE